MSPTPAGGLTDIPGIRVGHATDPVARTGCTVVLPPPGSLAGVHLAGAAPGTRETDLLRPGMLVEEVHAILLTGGSAFGLAAADGVTRWLAEHGIGFDTGVARVPIVPAAVLYDLGVGRADIRPDAAMGYAACQGATAGPVAEGAVGAGTGATVGKLLGPDGAMGGGVGTALITVAGQVRVAALVAVNALGDILDEDSGAIIAGARHASGEFANTARTLLDWQADLEFGHLQGRSTTLVIVATDALLTRTEAVTLARLAQHGLARVISPASTLLDGDVIFVLSIGKARANLVTLGVAASRVTATAITRAARIGNGLPVP